MTKSASWLICFGDAGLCGGRPWTFDGWEERGLPRHPPLSTLPPPLPTMASPAARKRLGKEFQAMQKSPPPFAWGAPDEKNILNCECAHPSS